MSRPRATGPTSGPGRSATATRSSSRSSRSSAARAWSRSGSRPTRPARPPCAAIVRCVDDLGGATAEFLTDRDTALMAGSRADGSPDLRARVGRHRGPARHAPAGLPAVPGPRPRARSSGSSARSSTTSSPGSRARCCPERPTLAWYDAQARHWALTVVAGRGVTGRRGGSSARPGSRSGALLTPVSRRLLARIDGADTLVPLPAPAAARRTTAAAGETVEVRPLAVYAELAR